MPVKTSLLYHSLKQIKEGITLCGGTFMVVLSHNGEKRPFTVMENGPDLVVLKDSFGVVHRVGVRAKGIRKPKNAGKAV